MTDACYPVVVGGQDCVQCDAITAVVGVPEQTIYTTLYGWTASAISQKRLAGDVYTEFTIPQSVGVVVGLETGRLNESPAAITHGFYCYEDTGNYYWAITESGVLKTTPAVRNTTDLMRIERRRGIVRYFLNGHQVYESLVPMAVDVIVVCCMYASGDGVD
jgi:hypothetical protein